MLPRNYLVVVAGTLSLGAILAAGCTAHDTKPSALTGRDTTVVSVSDHDRMRFTDSKGHYREDLRMAGNAQRP